MHPSPVGQFQKHGVFGHRARVAPRLRQAVLCSQLRQLAAKNHLTPRQARVTTETVMSLVGKLRNVIRPRNST